MGQRSIFIELKNQPIHRLVSNIKISLLMLYFVESRESAQILAY